MWDWIDPYRMFQCITNDEFKNLYYTIQLCSMFYSYSSDSVLQTFPSVVPTNEWLTIKESRVKQLDKIWTDVKIDSLPQNLLVAYAKLAAQKAPPKTAFAEIRKSKGRVVQEVSLAVTPAVTPEDMFLHQLNKTPDFKFSCLLDLSVYLWLSTHIFNTLNITELAKLEVVEKDDEPTVEKNDNPWQSSTLYLAKDKQQTFCHSLINLISCG